MNRQPVSEPQDFSDWGQFPQEFISFLQEIGKAKKEMENLQSGGRFKKDYAWKIQGSVAVMTALYYWNGADELPSALTIVSQICEAMSMS